MGGEVPVYMHPSFYRTAKLTFPRDIGGLSEDGTIKTEIGKGPDTDMFVLIGQHQ